MSGRVGLELTPERVRAVRLAPFSRRAAQSVDVPWDPRRPREAVAALTESLGSATSVSLAVGLGFLEVKHVELPPAPAGVRSRMVALEPERYFATDADGLVTALEPTSGIAFAAPRDLVAAWLAAFEEWAPISGIEPAPLAVARALGGEASGTYRLEAAADEVGLLRVEKGAVTSVRRLQADATVLASTLPSVRGVAPVFLAALGAALVNDGPLETALAPSAWTARLAARRTNRLALAAAGAAAALVFALYAADRWRDRTLDALEQETTVVTQRAAPAEAAMRARMSREAESATMRSTVAARPDPYGALAAISLALPRDAVVLSARATGNEWQVDGTARDASALVPRLDRDGHFDNVRFLSASSRYREGNRSYETFSIALRYRPRP